MRNDLIKRWLFNLASGASLLLCLAAAGLPAPVATQPSTQFVGLGLQLEQRPDGSILVQQPISGSPAAKGGVIPGDIILKVDGRSLQDVGIAQAVRSMAGPAGSQVRLTIRRPNGTVQDLLLTRRLIFLGQAPRSWLWLWILSGTVLCIVILLPWLRHRRRVDRVRRNLCIVCGYDLRATPDRCPECGTIPLKAAEAAQ